MKKITWNLEPVYQSAESDEYIKDKEHLTDVSELIIRELSGDAVIPKDRLKDLIDSFNTLYDTYENLDSYLYSLWTSDTSNAFVKKEINDLEKRALKMKRALVLFRTALSDGKVDYSECKNFSFWLTEQKIQGQKQMSPSEEDLASDLQRSGAGAWERLQERLSSVLECTWEENGPDIVRKTVTELRALAFSPERETRKKAWKLETSLWQNAEESFAASLNGIKGTSIVLDKRRGWGSPLEKSLFQNRISRLTLDSLIGVMNESLSMFRRYFKAKAKVLGIDKLSWYDLFAPVPSGEGNSGKTVWLWEETSEFIPQMFDTLSPEMGDFARKAFKSRWIDASPASGKIGGAYCAYFPLARESRILCNYDGSFDSLSTVAHELGHAWHGHVISDLPAVKREYPMTLAETASIFSETLVFNAAYEKIKAGGSSAEELSVLDTYLTGASQVIVDILSRFKFESSVFRLRGAGELSAADFTSIMLDSQQSTYGDAVDESELHGWMWAVKGHYYSADLAFYNYPYAFGLLFALGLYSSFREKGSGFFQEYKKLLRLTGSQSAEDVAAQAGFNIESVDFWRRSVAFIENLVSRYEFLSGK